MQFEFHGEKYRLIFHHEKSRRWSDHEGHDVYIGRNKAGIIRLFCAKCGGLEVGNIPKSDWKRNTLCIIQKYNGTDWVSFSYGYGVPAESKGDRFNRADGRHAALKNVLRRVGVHLRELTPDFMDAAWVAYDVRKAPKVRIHVG